MAKKKVTKKVTTKKPTGLSITRNGEWYTVKWKIGDANYDDGQQLQYKLSYQKKWHDLSIGRRATSKSLKLEKADFYPNSGKKKLTGVKFRIRGNRQEYKKETSKQETTYKCSWSDWASKEFVIAAPFKPTATVTLNNELTNVCTFGWSVVETANRPFTSIKWESRLAPKESNTTDGSKLTWKSTMAGWQTGTSNNASGSFPITEDTAVLANGSYTRWVRFIARGVAGASTGKPDGWTYVKHVYSVPFRPTIKSVNAQENNVGGFSCKVVWEAGSSSAHPIDKTTVQYTIVEPEEELSCPSGASWTDANISRDTSYSDSAFFSIDDTLSRDQCLFVRVNVQHDSHITYGTPKLAKVGYLKDPTGLSVQTDDVTHRATITATNASNIEDSFLAVVYQTASDPEGAFVVGIIPHGSSSVIVQCPDWSQESAVSFGVYAVVGDYKRQTRSDGVYTYVVNEQMRSKNTIRDGGTVPTAPSNVAVVQTSVQETVQVTWDWTWDEANGAEISWADHEDAWESTDEPETYVISKLHAAKWNISGLEAGKTWYIRVRLVNETAEATTNSPWSEAVAIDLSSAPTTPTLYLSSAVIPQDGSVTASWAYSTTDGTMQAYAEICEATIGSGGITYGDIIAHTETAQQTVINAKDAGWQSGETHNLCVRVTSASGHVSDSWSDPIAITVAEPLVCEITNTSLVQEHIENNPQEFESADIVSFETDAEEDVTKLQVSMNPKQSGSGTPSPSNVRPIYGHSGVTVYDSPTQDAEDGESYSQDFNVSLTPTSTDTDPYSFKAVGDIYGDRLEEDIVGGTVAWNQQKTNGNFESMNSYSLGDATGSVSNNVLTATATSDTTPYLAFGGEVIKGHKYLVLIDVKPSETMSAVAILYSGSRAFTRSENISGGNWHICGGIHSAADNANNNFSVYFNYNGANSGKSTQFRNCQIHDLTQMFGSTIADYIYSLEQANAGAGVAWFKKLFPKPYYEYNAGELMSVNTSAHNTVGFNQFDKSKSTAGKRFGGSGKAIMDRATGSISDYIRVIPNTTYYAKNVSGSDIGNTFVYYGLDKNWVGTYSISANSQASGLFTTPPDAYYMRFQYETVDEDTVCINLSWDGERNGEYEPYVKHSYPLDSDLELRGIPKLDASNNLYYDGDVYEPDGTVTRKYGIVDLGTLNWGYIPVASAYPYGVLYTSVVGKKYDPFSMICSKYKVNDDQTFTTDKVCLGNSSGNTFYAVDSAYTDAATFKTAMSGVYLVYELATPTTETADPFTQIQEVSKYGTLEYITTNDVPVGHNTTYYTRDVFGSTLDVVSGVLAVDRAMVDLDNTTKCEISSQTSDVAVFDAPFSVNEWATHSSTPNAISNRFSTSTPSGQAGRMVVSNQHLYFVIAKSELSSLDQSGARAWLNDHPTQFCYELATPQTYTLTPTEVKTLVGENNIWSNAGQVEVRIAEFERDVLSLKQMPLSVTATGSGVGGLTTLAIERAESYHLDRPDESHADGYEGETVFMHSQTGEDPIDVTVDSLIGALDDGAKYRIVAMVQDGLGQSAVDTLEFEVRWEHQAVIPEANVIIDDENLVAKITPVAPTGALAGDTCDIYRLSADRPELIVQDATFGQTYVDPYPAIGEFGGHRVVFKTVNGDYITEDNQMAWLDLGEDEGDILDLDYHVIDFDGNQIVLNYNVDLSSQWEKDFTETKYLGGSVQGDWNPAVSRTGSISATAITITDQEMIRNMRRLASYSGLCHVRTKDGSSYAADIQVTDDRSHEDYDKIATFSMTVTRVDPERLEGLTLEVWQGEQ